MALRTVGFTCVSIRTQEVFPSGNGFHVSGVDADGVATQVVNIQPVWDFSLRQFIGQTMSEKFPPLSSIIVKGEDSIAVVSHMPSPQQARPKIGAGWWDRAFFVDLLPKSVSKWLGTNPVFPIFQVGSHLFTSKTNVVLSISQKGE